MILSVTEGTDVVGNLIPEDVWGSIYELTVVLSENFESWDWLCLCIRPISLPMTNSISNNIKWSYNKKHNFIIKP